MLIQTLLNCKVGPGVFHSLGTFSPFSHHPARSHLIHIRPQQNRAGATRAVIYDRFNLFSQPL